MCASKTIKSRSYVTLFGVLEKNCFFCVFECIFGKWHHVLFEEQKRKRSVLRRHRGVPSYTSGRTHFVISPHTSSVHSKKKSLQVGRERITVFDTGWFTIGQKLTACDWLMILCLHEHERRDTFYVGWLKIYHKRGVLWEQALANDGKVA